MEYDDKLIESLKCQAQRLRRDVVISMGVGVAGHLQISWRPSIFTR